MKRYQVLARKYRPQRFSEVVGQEHLVTTLKNAIRRGRVAQAYLFCGPKGTGKTTLARLFSKALNCAQLREDGEPCNECPSCKGVMQGNALDMLEIDGASNRGIDDIRQLNETVGYAPSPGARYKIYLIDEVHMLTKEAFNALLKTLEEPPPQVVFFFATTEPHKVPPTIVSRCQRFNLQRIPLPLMCDKLAQIAADMEVEAEPQALRLIAEAAEGGLRDAQSLLDQALAYQEQQITAAGVTEMLGLVPQQALFALDRAIQQGHLAYAFELAHEVFFHGKDIGHFHQTLIEHFRHLLLLKVAGSAAAHLADSPPEVHESYATSAQLYTKEQCLTLLDLLVEAQQQPKGLRQTTLEALLLRLMRSYHSLPPEILLQRLTAMEERLAGRIPTPDCATPPPVAAQPTPPAAPPPVAAPAPKAKKAKPAAAPPERHPSHYDTLMRFAAVELEGTVKNPTKP